MKAQRKFLHPPYKNPKNWFDTKSLRQIHRTMFENVWTWAGSYRQSVTSIGIEPWKIPLFLEGFCEEVKYWLTANVQLSHIEMSAKIHHRLVQIHPFENGNGRFSRLVADRFLIALGGTHPQWPYQIQAECDARRVYISALQRADQGDLEPLMQLMEDLGAANSSNAESVEIPKGDKPAGSFPEGSSADIL